MSTPLKTLRDAVRVFEQHDCLYCLIGGHAASLYRSQERLTRDVDFALLTNSSSNSRKIAEKIIRAIGLEPVLGFIPPTSNEPKRKSICMVTAKASDKGSKGIIDILLPELPWVENAVTRAQENKLNLGFAYVPVITPEDLVVAKCYALRNAPDRFQDLDDLKEIFSSVKDLNFNYINDQLDLHKLEIPAQVQKYKGE